MAEMMISTTESVPGFENKKFVGLVWATSARSKDFLDELKAFLRTATGGRILEFESMMASGKSDVVQAIASQAKEKGANAVVGFKLGTTTIASGTVETYAYGTAVVVAVEKSRR